MEMSLFDKMESKNMEIIKRTRNQIVIPRSGRLKRVITIFEGDDAVSMTQQQFKDDTDVNVIMRKYKSINRAVAEIGHGKTGVYGDFDAFGSYQESLDKVLKMRENFMALPSEIRTRFGNDPEQMVKFLDDPNNLEESVKLGLRVTRKQETNPVVEEIKALREDIKPKKEKKPSAE